MHRFAPLLVTWHRFLSEIFTYKPQTLENTSRLELFGDFSHPEKPATYLFQDAHLLCPEVLRFGHVWRQKRLMLDDVGLISSDFDPFGKLGCLVSTKASTGSRWYHLTQIYEVFNYTLHYYGIPGIPYHYDDICCERTLGQRWEFWNVQVSPSLSSNMGWPAKHTVFCRSAEWTWLNMKQYSCHMLLCLTFNLVYFWLLSISFKLFIQVAGLVCCAILRHVFPVCNSEGWHPLNITMVTL